jgi:hypothetical protein
MRTRSSSAVICCLLSLSAGCGRRAAPDAETVSVPKLPVAPAADVTWTPSLVEDGYIFRNEAAFRDYVGRAQVVAVGTLTSWDERRGRLRVERVLRGQVGAELPLLSSGGFVRPAPGTRVIALLSSRDGRLTLHSFCAAGGVYRYTDPLAAYVEVTLRGRSS